MTIHQRSTRVSSETLTAGRWRAQAVGSALSAPAASVATTSARPAVPASARSRPSVTRYFAAGAAGVASQPSALNTSSAEA